MGYLLQKALAVIFAAILVVLAVGWFVESAKGLDFGHSTEELDYVEGYRIYYSTRHPFRYRHPPTSEYDHAAAIKHATELEMHVVACTIGSPPQLTTKAYEAYHPHGLFTWLVGYMAHHRESSEEVHADIVQPGVDAITQNASEVTARYLGACWL